MAKKPDDRYQQPREVAQALIPFLHEVGKETARSKPLWLVGGLAAVLLAIGILIGIKWLGEKEKLALSGSSAIIEPGTKAGLDSAWRNEVATLPAQKQVEAVAGKLKERNPDFDGKVTPTIDDGVVTGVDFSTDQVSDISPLRALTGLRTLRCAGTHGKKGGLVDLSPRSRAWKLTSLDFYVSQVSDLSPLRGMPLTSLNCGHSPVSDLAPLAGMKLTALDCYLSRVSDLAPLAGMPLTYLKCGCWRVSNLSRLEGGTLTVLEFGATPVADLSPLEGMPLRELVCGYSQVADLSPVKNMKLTILHVGTTRIWPTCRR